MNIKKLFLIALVAHAALSVHISECATEKPYALFLKDTQNRSYSVPVNTTDTVLYVKKQIEQQGGLPVKDQMLWINQNHQVLDDAQSVQDLIGPNIIIHILSIEKLFKQKQLPQKTLTPLTPTELMNDIQASQAAIEYINIDIKNYPGHVEQHIPTIIFHIQELITDLKNLK